MSRKKQPESWADKINGADGDTSAAMPMVGALIPTQEPTAIENQALRARCLSLEIRAKELEQGLYLAKARICELELEKLKGTQE